MADFIHRIVVHRGDEATRSWIVGFVRTLWSGLFVGCVQIWFLPLPFLRCDPRLTPGGSGVLACPDRIDEEFRKAWLPYFCRSGQREASLEEFNEEVVGWLPLLPEVHFSQLTGQPSGMSSEYDVHSCSLSSLV